MCLKSIFKSRITKFNGVPEKVVRRWKVCKVNRSIKGNIISIRPLFIWDKTITKKWLKSWYSNNLSISQIKYERYIAGFHVFTKKKDAQEYLEEYSHLDWADILEVLKVECAGQLASGNQGVFSSKNRIEVYQYIRLIE